MKSNFNYEVIIKAREKSKSFRALDDEYRALILALAKENNKSLKSKYNELSLQREKALQDFVKIEQDTKPQKIDLAPYKRLDQLITQKLDVFIAKFPNTKLKNIVLMGATGTGKTYCAKVIAQALEAKNWTTYFTTTFNLVKRLRDELYGQDPTATDDMLDCDLLIIDDLGAEPTIKNSDEFLYNIINERYANNKSFIITTNLNKDQVLQRYDQRLFGRIFDKSRTASFTFRGKDLRID